MPYTKVALLYKKLGCREAFLKINYPHICEIVEDCFDDVVPKAKEIIKKFLQDIIDNENDIRTLKEIADSINISEYSLRSIAPDLCTAITYKRRTVRHQHNLESKKEQELEVINCCEKLVAQKKFSDWHLYQCLKKPGCMRNPRLREIADEYYKKAQDQLDNYHPT